VGYCTVKGDGGERVVVLGPGLGVGPPQKARLARPSQRARNDWAAEPHEWYFSYMAAAFGAGRRAGSRSAAWDSSARA